MATTVSRPNLGRKQRANHHDWQYAWETVEAWSDGDEARARVKRWGVWLAAVIRERGWQRVAFGWSGGKDSLALEILMREAGVKHCVMGICNLEYPAFLQWVTDHMPNELTVLNTGQDLAWLREHPNMLFPQDAATAARWFEIVQHKAQAEYVSRHRIDCLILGRRRVDGNSIPRGQELRRNGQGVLHWSPLADWTHEQVLETLYWYGVQLPPIYSWPNGWRCGTHAWAARQWTGSIANGWAEVATIDRGIVEHAARYFPDARRALQ